MNNKKMILFGALVFGLSLGMILVVLGTRIRPRPKSNEDTLVIEQEASYLLLSLAQMIDESDAIFLGRVAGFSPTQWNQNSGEYWANDESSALQLHTVEFTALQPIVDTIDLGQRVALTVLGQSPLEGEAEYDLAVGDQAIIFAVQRDLAWREGLRPVIRFTNAPGYSYLRQGDDGLYSGLVAEQPLSMEQLKKLISEIGKPLVQP